MLMIPTARGHAIGNTVSAEFLTIVMSVWIMVAEAVTTTIVTNSSGSSREKEARCVCGTDIMAAEPV